MTSPLVSCLTLSMNRSIDWATWGKLSRSHWPSNCEGIAEKSSAVMLTIPVTWLTLPS